VVVTVQLVVVVVVVVEVELVVVLFVAGPPLWSSGQSSWVQIEVWVRFPTLPDFLRSSGSGTGSTQPREYN
jgi:hypothetical protein